MIIRNTIEMYNEKINNYKFEYAKESNDINNFNFSEIKIFIKKISGNGLIDLLSEDQGKFGYELDIEDVV